MNAGHNIMNMNMNMNMQNQMNNDNYSNNDNNLFSPPTEDKNANNYYKQYNLTDQNDFRGVIFFNE